MMMENTVRRPTQATQQQEQQEQQEQHRTEDISHKTMAMKRESLHSVERFG